MNRISLPSRYFSHNVNREVTELYASTAIGDMAISMIMVFEPIFLVTVLGFGVTEVLLFFAGVYFLYIVLMPFVAKITARIGYKHSILFSIPFQILYWISLYNSPDNNFLIYFAIIFLALQKSLFWPAFHSDMANFSSKNQRSREFSGIIAISHIVYILGPLLGGYISYLFGLKVLFIFASALYFTMFIPLFATPDGEKGKYYSYKKTLELYKKFKRESVAFGGYGEELLLLTIWPIFIFSVIPNFFNLGALVGVATLIATLLLLVVGKFSDKGRRDEFLFGGVFMSICVWIGRIFSSTVTHVFTADAFSRISRDIFLVPLISKVYDHGSEQKNPLVYSIFFEQSLSIGKLSACLIGALLFFITESFISLFVLAIIYSFLYMAMPKKKRQLFGI